MTCWFLSEYPVHVAIEDEVQPTKEDESDTDLASVRKYVGLDWSISLDYGDTVDTLDTYLAELRVAQLKRLIQFSNDTHLELLYVYRSLDGGCALRKVYIQVIHIN